MRRINKEDNSKVLTDRINYISGNSTNNRKLLEVLMTEQKGYCAYTDEYISRAEAKDVEHFNPTLKDTPDDSYSNWFVVKHQWNMEKSKKWELFQPVLHPSAADLEERVIYDNGDYLAHPTDIEARNLIKLLKLDDLALAEERKRYISRKEKEMRLLNQGAMKFFSMLLSDDACQVNYLRAIKEEFKIDIWNMIE